MTIAVLAVQGAFIEHEMALQKLGADCIELRKAEDLNQPYDGIVLPGGESTVQGKLLRELGMFDTIQSQIKNGMPVLATCAGMILLADKIDGDDRTHLATLPMTVKRNAYGRQLGSFHTTAELKGIGNIPMTFIRAPYVVSAADDVEILWKIVSLLYVTTTSLHWHSIRNWMNPICFTKNSFALSQMPNRQKGATLHRSATPFLITQFHFL
jgi:5'-phosphate synthase pdxT subunit